MTVAALPILTLSSASKDRLLEIVEPRSVNLQGVIANSSCRCSADILSHDVGLLEADGETKLYARLCKNK
jgi:hypothetical protein